MFSSDLFTKFSCTYCQEEISGVLTKCVECKDFALCLQCFAAGAEIGPHKNDHSYQFIVSDSDAQDLFKSKGGWSAREELLLLNGIEGFGFGNWKDIALKLENRTSEECKDEYIRTFLEGTIGRLTWPTEAERKKKVQDYGAQGSSTSVPQRMAPVDLTLEQAEILGYMINRDDFEKEYNNNAESIISQLNISTTEDDELDVALKLAQVDMYVDQLRERKRRKRIARDYQLITRFFNSLYRTKPANHEQAELEDKLRFLCQFLTCQEFESFIPSWLRETGLRRRGAELSRYRQSGLTRYEEIPHFEQESIYRSDCKSSLLLNPNSSPVLVGSTSSGTCTGLVESMCSGALRSGSLHQSASRTGIFSASATLPAPSSPSASTSTLANKKKRRKRKSKLLFHRKKHHVPHRHPKIIAANRARAAALAAARQSLQIH